MANGRLPGIRPRLVRGQVGGTAVNTARTHPWLAGREDSVTAAVDPSQASRPSEGLRTRPTRMRAQPCGAAIPGTRTGARRRPLQVGYVGVI
jgi:hypothetical protein